MKPLLPLVFWLCLWVSLAHATGPVASDLSPIDTDESTNTISKHNGTHTQQTTQTSKIGAQNTVKVTTEVGTYIVKPNQTVGNALPGDVQSSSNHAAQWVVKSWGSPDTTEPPDTPPHLQPNPDASRESIK